MSFWLSISPPPPLPHPTRRPPLFARCRCLSLMASSVTVPRVGLGGPPLPLSQGTEGDNNVLMVPTATPHTDAAGAFIKVDMTHLLFSLRQYYTLLSPSFAQRERCRCFQRVSIHVIFQTLTGSQGTPPLPLFDVNNTDAHSQEIDTHTHTHTVLFFLFLPPNTGGVVFTVCFLSCPRLLSAKGVIRLRQPNG